MNQKNDKNKERREKNEKIAASIWGIIIGAALWFWCVSYGAWYFKRYIKFWPKKGRVKNEKENHCGSSGSGRTFNVAFMCDSCRKAG